MRTLSPFDDLAEKLTMNRLGKSFSVLIWVDNPIVGSLLFSNKDDCVGTMFGKALVNRAKF